MKGVFLLLLFYLLFFAVVLADQEDQGEDEDGDSNKGNSNGNKFDFIVVGAGASGSVVAARLINEGYRVLLLEGGREGTGQRDLGGTDYVMADFATDPVTGEQTLTTPLTRYDVSIMVDSIRQASDVLKNTWNITGVGPFYSQAKVLGGNMATNGMAWFPLLKADFNAWNIPDFTAAQFWPYLKMTENATGTGYLGNPNRGYSGPIHVISPSFIEQSQLKFLQVANAYGYTNGTDPNTGTLAANKVYLWQRSIRNGVRSATTLEYLKPLLKNAKLTIRLGCTVTEILFKDTKVDEKWVATGVRYSDAKGVLRTVRMKREVVIAAGDLQTAKLLYNSGIGPSNVLNAFNKPRRVVNEMVGQKIRNHLRSILSYTDPTLTNPNFYSYPSASVQYARTGKGIVAERGSYMLTFNTSGCATSALHPCPDVWSTASAVVGASPGDLYAQKVDITIYNSRNSYANGTVSLTSSDPLAGTIFTANAFVMDDDVETLAKGMFEMRKMMASKWPTAVETSPGSSVNTMQAMKNWVKTNGVTTCHYYGSAPMGTTTAYPTDTRWNVRGTSKLRLVGPAVVPGAVFPGMQSLAAALGEKGAAMIIADN